MNSTRKFKQFIAAQVDDGEQRVNGGDRRVFKNKRRAKNDNTPVFAIVFAILVVVAVSLLLTVQRGNKAEHFNDECQAVSSMGIVDAQGEVQCSGVMFRSSDGSDHGIRQWLGAEGTALGRYVSPGNYTEAYDDRARPNARQLSNALCAQDINVTPKHQHFSSLMWSFGQFVDHMISLSPGECGGGASKIRVSMDGDPHFDPANRGIELVVDTTHYLEEPQGYRQPITIITHFVDGNAVYGSTSGRTQQLREFKDGLMKTTTLSGKPGEYPPYNTIGMDNVGGRRNPAMFLLGDLRANEQIPLTSLHTLFLREHNYQARRILQGNPEWSDECVFQQAKKVVVAELQRVIFEEFVPTLIGEQLPAAQLDLALDPRIYVEFSTAAYRFHTLVNEKILRLDPATGQQLKTPLALREGFANPQQLKADGVESILLGLLKQNAEQVDTKMVDSLRNFLFFKDGDPLDLAVMNIVRGREHGIPHFSALRQSQGLGKLRSWADLTSDAGLRAALQQQYGVNGYRNVDAWVGLFAEDKPANKPLGHTLGVIVADQFRRLRDGDPHYYEFDPFVSQETRDYVRRESTFRKILLRNTNIARQHVQEDPFRFSAAAA